MPVPVGERVLTNQETIQALRANGSAQFRLRLFRGSAPTLIAVFENAAVDHFVQPQLWIPGLCGGGRYALEASLAWDSRYESDVIRRIGGLLTFELEGAGADVSITAPLRQMWRGPTGMTFPEHGTVVEAAPGRRVPQLRDPLRHFTLGFSPPAPLMIDGKYASPPNAGYFDTMYLFGEGDSKSPDYFPRHDFSFGQDQSRRDDMPGIYIRVNGQSWKGGHFSLEVVKACSQGHVDASLLSRQGEVIKAVGHDELMVDAMVQLYMGLDRLKKLPLVGYFLNPVIAFTREDDIKIEGVPPGMRLYLTGVCEMESR